MGTVDVENAKIALAIQGRPHKASGTNRALSGILGGTDFLYTESLLTQRKLNGLLQREK